MAKKSKAPIYQSIAFFIFPLIICAVYAAPVGLSDALFYLEMAGTEFSIGTQGYTVNGVQAIARPTFDYPSPDSWPDPIPGIPKLLIAHFAISILLAIYLIVFLTALLAQYFRRPSSDRAKGSYDSGFKQAANQQGWLGYLTLLAIALVLGLTVGDMVLGVQSWQAGKEVGKFKPTALGSALAYVGGIFGVLWLLLFIVVRIKNRRKDSGEYRTGSGEKAPKKRSKK